MLPWPALATTVLPLCWAAGWPLTLMSMTFRSGVVRWKSKNSSSVSTVKPFRSPVLRVRRARKRRLGCAGCSCQRACTLVSVCLFLHSYRLACVSAEPHMLLKFKNSLASTQLVTPLSGTASCGTHFLYSGHSESTSSLLPGGRGTYSHVSPCLNLYVAAGNVAGQSVCVQTVVQGGRARLRGPAMTLGTTG